MFTPSLLSLPRLSVPFTHTAYWLVTLFHSLTSPCSPLLLPCPCIPSPHITLTHICHSAFTVPLPTSLETPHVPYPCSLSFMLIPPSFPLIHPSLLLFPYPPTLFLSHSPPFSLLPAHYPFPSVNVPTLNPLNPIFTCTFSALLACSATHLLRHSSKDLSISTLFQASW